MNTWELTQPLERIRNRVCEGLRDDISLLLNFTAGENSPLLKGPLEFETLLSNTFFFQLLDDNAKWLPDLIKTPVGRGRGKINARPS